MRDTPSLKAIEAGVKLYRADLAAHQIVDMCAAHAMKEQGEPDDYDFRKFAQDVAKLATATLLQHVYQNDGELRRIRDERDHYKRIAEEALRVTPFPLQIITGQPTRGDETLKTGGRAKMGMSENG